MKIEVPFKPEEFVDDSSHIVEGIERDGIRRTYDLEGNLISEISLKSVNRKWYIFEKEKDTPFVHGCFGLYI